MTIVAISELRAHLPAFIKKVRKGEEIILTSRGKAVAHLVPPDKAKRQAQKSLKALRQKCRIGDILSPIEAPWGALK